MSTIRASRRVLGCSLVGIVLFFAAASRADDDVASSKVSFARQVRPIFNQHCIACHGGIKQAGDVSFVYRDLVVSNSDDDGKPVVAGAPDDSELLFRVSSTDPEERMPPVDHGDPLSAEQIEILRRWIAEGAVWEEHWAFTPLAKDPLPGVQDPTWCRSSLDYFVLQNLERAGLAPSPDADPSTWLRRVSFDLIGLPPTEAELDEFLADSSPAAREKVVDRLLASPRFGERWATPWLDLARYADTMGYEKDPPRQIWPYRDWVIRAFNEDMPLEQFTVAQLAGDLLPDSSMSDRVATAFHRNTQANTEGGTDDEEFRITAVIDRVNTTAQVWWGLTLGCAQCHDHPYEPITNTEYYQFLAYFNNTRDFDTNEEFPLWAIPYKFDEWADADQLDLQIRDRRARTYEMVADKFDPSGWRNATIVQASATGGTELHISNQDGKSELRTGEKVVSGSNYSVDCQAPAESNSIAALMLEVPPIDAQAAAKIPESGFVLSYFKLQLVPPTGDPIDIPIRLAFEDDPDPFYTAAESLNPNLQGWSSYPRLSRTNCAIFVPSSPIELTPQHQLRLVLEQHSSSEHLFQIRRLRVWLSEDSFWSDSVVRSELELLECEIADLSNFRRSVNSISIPVTSELSPQRARETRVLHRGSFLEPKDVVQPAVPRVIARGSQPHDRLELARWFASADNPLAARVFVNRIWYELFGTGLVESVENFGSSGQFPSNEPLLDHLASRYHTDHTGRLKPLLREIVLSRAYGQSAIAPSDKWADDPRNRQLARGPRNRLSAEMIRDQALAVSGLLSEKMYGLPVMPPQPDGLWLSAYSGESWRTSTGEDRFRRALYTYCKRTSGYPGLLTFDAPTRDVCVVQRVPTNTPLQALVTLNDPAFVEMAEAFGRLMEQATAASTRDKIAWGYRRATCKVPSAGTLDSLVELFDEVRSLDENPAGNTEAAFKAYATVASAILNTDEAMTK